MSVKGTALYDAYRAWSDLRGHLANRFEELLNAKGVRYDSWELLEVNPDGFTLQTEYSSCGDTDRDDYFFPMSDLDVDIDELNARTAARLEAARIRREAVQARQVAHAEARERVELKRLAAKYPEEVKA
jgi:hypothetical protein